MLVHNVSAGLASLVVVSAASASTIIVDQMGGAMEMHSFDMTGEQAGQVGVISETELSDMHQMLNAGGIETDGRITFFLADTDYGLSFMTLVDSNAYGNPSPLTVWDSSIVMSSTGPDDLVPWINAEGDDQTFHQVLGNGIQTFDALFTWQGASEADAFSWSGLDLGDAVSYHFTDQGGPGLDSSLPFQFLSYGGNGWEVVGEDDFSSNDQFVFSYTVTEIPAPSAIALLGLAGLASRRRRR